MPPGVGIPYDPSDLSQHIHAQLEGLGELAIYLTRSVSFRGAASAGPSQVKAGSTENKKGESTEKKKQVAEMEMALRRVHLGDEWWVDMTEQEMLGYLERKEKGECQLSPTNSLKSSSLLNELILGVRLPSYSSQRSARTDTDCFLSQSRAAEGRHGRSTEAGTSKSSQCPNERA
jgi:hypothetical protein